MQDSREILALSSTFKMVQGVLQDGQEGQERLQEWSAIELTPPGTIIDSKYRIINLLDQGGMGAVYRAHHLSLKKDVALKTFRSPNLSRKDWERFQREAQAIAKLDNKNIVRVFDFGIAEGNQPYYTMELLSGESLAARLMRQGALPISEAVRIFTDVAEGLVSAHAKGIVHRDLKPGNIFLVLKDDEVVSVKLVDFGIAKLVGARELEAQRLTAAGTIFGSPLYMSPEQSLGEDTDERSDIYSFACALYETLTGRPPFVGNNAFATICSHQSDAAPRLADSSPDKTFPSWLETLIHNMLTKKREKRAQSFQEVLEVFSLYKNSASKKPASNPAKRPAPQEMPRQELLEDTGQRPTNPDVGNNHRNVILAILLISVVIGTSVYSQRDSLWLRQATANLQKLPVQPGKSAILVKTSQTAKSATLVETAKSRPGARFFQGTEPTPRGPVKVFKFPPVCIGYFGRGEGSRISYEKCQGVVKIPVSDTETFFVPTAHFILEPIYFAGFKDDDLVNVHLDPEVLRGYSWSDMHVRDLRQMTGLQTLSLRKCEVTGAAVPDIGKFKALKSLDVSDTMIRGQDLAKLTNLDGLQILNAMRVDHMSEFLRLVDESKLKLLAVSFKDTHLQDQDVAEVAKIQTLQNLGLEGNPITDAGIRYLTKLPQLHVLLLSGTNIGPGAIDTLGQIKTLTGVSLSSPPFGQKDEAKLKGLVPGCLVHLQPRLRP